MALDSEDVLPQHISRWYLSIIIVIFIHPQFHFHTQHKQFTPEISVELFTHRKKEGEKKTPKMTFYIDTTTSMGNIELV